MLTRLTVLQGFYNELDQVVAILLCQAPRVSSRPDVSKHFQELLPCGKTNHSLTFIGVRAMLATLWLLTGAVFILTLLAAFAIPSWPVLVVFLLSLLATIGYRLTRIRAVPVIALTGALLICAYDVVMLIIVLHTAR